MKKALIIAVEATIYMKSDNQFQFIQEEIIKFVKFNQTQGGEYDLPFRLDLFTFFDNTSPTISYEKFGLFERSFNEEMPR